MLGPRQKKARLDLNSNIDSSHSDDTDPDDPLEEGDATTLNTTKTYGSGEKYKLKHKNLFTNMFKKNKRTKIFKPPLFFRVLIMVK